MKCTLLFFCFVFFSSVASNTLRQATRADIVRREKWSDLIRRGTGGTPNPCKRKRANDGEFFADRSVFSGVLLSAEEVASYLIGDGVWHASNGSEAIDYSYLHENSMYRRSSTNPGVGWMKRQLNKAGTALIAWAMLDSFEDSNRVLLLSEDFGVANNDMMYIIKALLAREDWSEVYYGHHAYSRPMLEDILGVLCPRLGTAMCGDTTKELPGAHYDA